MTDLRYEFSVALHALKRDPVFCLVGVLIIVVGVGINATAYTLYDALLVDSGNVENHDRIHVVVNSSEAMGVEMNPVSRWQYDRWKEHASIERAALMRLSLSDARIKEEALALVTVEVTEDFFEVFEHPFPAGRRFDPEPFGGGPPQAVLSYEIWRRHFDRDPNVVGQAIEIDGVSYTISGVAGRGVSYNANVWIPLRDASDVDFPFAFRSFMMVLLKEGTDRNQLEADLDELFHTQLEEAGIQAPPGLDLRPAVKSIYEFADSSYGWIVYLLQGGAVFVFLMGCLNLSHLYLGKVHGRLSEMAIRLAHGASRGSIYRTVVYESLLIIGVGIVVSWIFSLWAIELVNSLVLQVMDMNLHLSFDPVLIGMGAVGLLIAVLLVSALPIFVLGRLSLQTIFKNRGFAVTPGRVDGILQHSLVGVQVGMAIVALFVAGGLFARVSTVFTESLPEVYADNNHALVTVASMAPPPREELWRAQAVLQRKFGEAEGPPVVSFNARIPLNLVDSALPFQMEEDPPETKPRMAFPDVAAPHLFEVLHMECIAGRLFTEEESRNGAAKLVVDREFAARFGGADSVVGKKLNLAKVVPELPSGLHEVIGVVDDRGVGGGLLGKSLGTMYVPMGSASGPRFTLQFIHHGLPQEANRLLDEAEEELGGAFKFFPVLSYSDSLAESRRFVGGPLAVLMGTAGLLTLLSLIGLSGILRYAVLLRLRDFAIRAALGEAQRSVFLRVVGRGVRAAIFGVLGGLAIALPVAYGIDAWVFGQGRFRLSLALVLAALFLLATVLSSLRPAHMVSRSSPAQWLNPER